MITWRKNENCDQSYLTKKQKKKKETFKLSDNILRNRVFFIKMIRDVQAVKNEYSRTGNDLKIKFLSNSKRMIAPGDILSLRLTL